MINISSSFVSITYYNLAYLKRKEEEEEAEMRRLEAEALEEAERIRIEEEEERLADLQRGESNGETREMNQIFREASKKSRRESRRQSVDPGAI